jgi:hypothetical protein
MARLNTTRTIDRQTLMYNDINWQRTTRLSPLAPSSGNPPLEMRGTPIGLRSGITTNTLILEHTPEEVVRPPYWEFDYELHPSSGLRFTNVVVRDATSAGSSDNVFESIEFDDLEIQFTDGTPPVAFDMAAALISPSAVLLVSEGGTRRTVTPNDTLFQRGLKLTVTHDVLAASGGSQIITVEISVVFRGAANDFDPGGVPVALDLWPQIGLTWERGSKVVDRMRGSVKLLPISEMSHVADSPASTHENVAAIFTDSNESMNDGRADDDRIRTWGASWIGQPFGWLMVFDYLIGNVTKEKELIGVYGPKDGNKYSQSASSARRIRYRYPPGSPYRMVVAKKDRQGDYDNTHMHANMGLDRCNNVAVHAPFCAHSCVHLHWRWAGIAADSSVGDRAWQFKGWDKGVTSNYRHTALGPARGHMLAGSPLIPPNQRLMFALCRPGATRHSADHIINSAAPGALDPLRKLYWYCVDVIQPHFKEVKPGDRDWMHRQVIFEQGIGWAYRYALEDEAKTTDRLTDAIGDDLPITLTDTPTRHEMMEFFQEVYELFRYRDDFGNHIGSCVDGVPPGTYDGGTGTAMEDL